MNTTELLSRVEKELDPAVVRACRLGATDDAAHFHYERPQRMAPGIRGACWLLFFIGTALLARGVANAFLTIYDKPSTADVSFCWVMALALSGFCVAGAVLTLSEYVLEPWSGERERPYLAKIAGTEFCEQVVEYIDKSTWARQWRDSALTTRSELRIFDALVMKALLHADVQDTDNQLRSARYDAACKKAHGIA